MTVRHLALMTLVVAAVLLGSQGTARAGYITSLDLTGGLAKSAGAAPIEGEIPREVQPVPAGEFGDQMVALALAVDSSSGGMGNSSAGSSHSGSGAVALFSLVPTVRELQQLRFAQHVDRFHPLLLSSRYFRPPRV